ncbi:MAG TPA: SUMF1/EgtB/PvdO family nonheme iron enzyme [Vicinamibacterales bacterium]|nr:SUMF1/EgtB/PvdO family nonheme iron enzyme [Vicinamibacterales bacterium]
MTSSTLLAAACAALFAAPALDAQPAAPSQTGYRETIPGTAVTFEMVQVPAGTVTLDGKPVAVGPFAIGRTEVTWDMYDVFALGLDSKGGSAAGPDAVARPSQPYGSPDYGWGHAGYAAISVTRSAAQAFADWLSARTGRPYRLPTEAEWVHAAQLAAGGGALADARRDELAWHRGNSDARSHAVASKKPDALGLYDLFGNAAEWVTTAGEDLVTRGGSFRDPPETVGPAARAEQDDAWNERDPQLPKSSWWLSDGPFVGFRLVLPGELPKSSKSP